MIREANKITINSTSLKSFLSNSNSSAFKIGKHLVGKEHPAFITAEIGINFDKSKEKAFFMIDVASESGCDGVKFQIFKSESMYAKNAGNLITASGEKVEIHNLIKEAELPLDWLYELKAYSNKRGLEFFASVCDELSADALEKVSPSAYKIASYEITHIPLIKYVAKKGKTIIFSIGGARLDEIVEAVQVIKETGNSKIVLMHCIAQYNAPLNTLNLNTLKTLQLQFPEIVIGYSDHSSDPVIAPSAAVALGAKMIEKHITYDRKASGPDHSFALEPKELVEMVKSIRQVEKLISKGKKILVDSVVLGLSKIDTYFNEDYIRKFAYRMIYATSFIPKGESLNIKNTAILRSGDNYRKLSESCIQPKYYDFLINKKRKVYVNRDILPGQAIVWDDILGVK